MRGSSVGAIRALLIDTQFDLPRTQAMLDEMRPIVAASPIRYAVNTHGNGDHCYGNELLAADTEIWAAPEATTHMRAEPPALIAGMLTADLEPDLRAYLHRAFGRFEFIGIHQLLPDHTLTADSELRVGHRSVRLLRSGRRIPSGMSPFMTRTVGSCSPGTCCSSAQLRSCGPARRRAGSMNWTGCWPWTPTRSFRFMDPSRTPAVRPRLPRAACHHEPAPRSRSHEGVRVAGSGCRRSQYQLGAGPRAHGAAGEIPKSVELARPS